jgi:hypothetical protein
MPRLACFACLALLLLGLASPTLAVLSDSEDARPVSNDPDYTAALRVVSRVKTTLSPAPNWCGKRSTQY